MGTRRLIASIRNGKSLVVADEAATSNAFSSVPGFDPLVLWGTPATPGVPWDGVDQSVGATVLPAVGATKLMVVTFPPDSVMMADDFDPQAAGSEYAQRLPGLAELMEAENPGMHATDTIDYDIVLEGEITVEFDDGACVDLKTGDVLIQYGTRHGWRNRTNKPAKMIFVLVGAQRS